MSTDHSHTLNHQLQSLRSHLKSLEANLEDLKKLRTSLSNSLSSSSYQSLDLSTKFDSTISKSVSVSNEFIRRGSVAPGGIPKSSKSWTDYLFHNNESIKTYENEVSLLFHALEESISDPTHHLELGGLVQKDDAERLIAIYPNQRLDYYNALFERVKLNVYLQCLKGLLYDWSDKDFRTTSSRMQTNQSSLAKYKKSFKNIQTTSYQNLKFIASNSVRNRLLMNIHRAQIRRNKINDVRLAFAKDTLTDVVGRTMVISMGLQVEKKICKERAIATADFARYLGNLEGKFTCHMATMKLCGSADYRDEISTADSHIFTVIQNISKMPSPHPQDRLKKVRHFTASAIPVSPETSFEFTEQSLSLLSKDCSNLHRRVQRHMQFIIDSTSSRSQLLTTRDNSMKGLLEQVYLHCDRRISPSRTPTNEISSLSLLPARLLTLQSEIRRQTNNLQPMVKDATTLLAFCHKVTRKYEEAVVNKLTKTERWRIWKRELFLCFLTNPAHLLDLLEHIREKEKNIL
ncbi:hypothetical protein BKA69DRAFT_1071104, partial [Paraphysoderma sedebokerense]